MYQDRKGVQETQYKIIMTVENYLNKVLGEHPADAYSYEYFNRLGFYKAYVVIYQNEYRLSGYLIPGMEIVREIEIKNYEHFQLIALFVRALRHNDENPGFLAKLLADKHMLTEEELTE